MRKRDFLAGSVGAGIGLAATSALAQVTPAATPSARRIMFGTDQMVNSGVQPSSVDLNYKPRRINKVIELWEDGQPIYDDVVNIGGGADNYALGLQMAHTYLDAINIDFEHGAVDISALREFMRGLVDGGPTRSGHRTPCVWVQTGIIALDEAYMRANTWMLEQFLDCGVHGIQLCHARDSKAVAVAAQMAMRYPFERPGVPNLPMRGLRGAGAGFPPGIWGVTQNEYLNLADTWPLNPKGEMIFGIKIEDTFADVDAAKSIATPGVSFAEWGPGDHSFWLYGLSIFPENGPSPAFADLARRPEMVKVRQNVFDLCKKNNVKFLDVGAADPNRPGDVIKNIQQGVNILEADEKAAIIGREYTKRKMPV